MLGGGNTIHTSFYFYVNRATLKLICMDDISFYFKFELLEVEIRICLFKFSFEKMSFLVKSETLTLIVNLFS